ncbi:MFS general substrate transporter [Ascobolus immersus RN42]|uniref:MFS general substrate transporter n=1 Tax=Ascobolus immersus RN42 TaxID=1160509 RepID=A0A3N4HTR7_ASCIM|nr:MFS general substrate transporter [Ascobolus immersus RN42]
MDVEHDTAKLIRKIDLRLMPGMAVLYLMLFLLKQNIGNAKTYGLMEDLHMSHEEYQLALTVFFITYSLFDIPSNMLLKLFKPNIWLPFITVLSGIVGLCMGVANSGGSIIAIRTILGLVECGLFPGVAYTISGWYLKKEAQFRQALFFCAASMAGAFAGVLAIAINKMDGVGNYAGWRWIFILEGLLTVVVGVIAFWFVVKPLDDVAWLSENEKRFLKRRFIIDEFGAGDEELIKRKLALKADASGEGVSKTQILKSVLLDWKVYAHTLIFIGVTCPLYSISMCLPTLIKQMGHSSTMANILTIPVYIVACLCSMAVAWAADRTGRRAPFLFGSYGVMLIGFIICVFRKDDAPNVGYGGLFIAACGCYPALPGMITWFSNNVGPASKRNIAMAVHIGIGSFGGAIGANFYRDKDKPKYVFGHAMNILFVAIAYFCIALIFVTYKTQNKKRLVLREERRNGVREKVEAEWRVQGRSEKDVVGLEEAVRRAQSDDEEKDLTRWGDESIFFTYML